MRPQQSDRSELAFATQFNMIGANATEYAPLIAPFWEFYKGENIMPFKLVTGDGATHMNPNHPTGTVARSANVRTFTVGAVSVQADYTPLGKTAAWFNIGHICLVVVMLCLSTMQLHRVLKAEMIKPLEIIFKTINDAMAGAFDTQPNDSGGGGGGKRKRRRSTSKKAAFEQVQSMVDTMAMALKASTGNHMDHIEDEEASTWVANTYNQNGETKKKDEDRRRSAEMARIGSKADKAGVGAELTTEQRGALARIDQWDYFPGDFSQKELFVHVEFMVRPSLVFWGSYG